jgi:hypothetical protein
MKKIMGEYAAKIQQVLSTYQGPPLIQALEILIKSACERAADIARTDASDVCEGLHVGEPRGLKCLKCYEAEQGFADVVAAEAEIEAAKSMEEDDEASEG